MTAKRNPDTFGSQDPEWIARCRADIAEYESYLPKITGNGGTGSTKAKIPKAVPCTSVHPNRVREGS